MRKFRTGKGFRFFKCKSRNIFKLRNMKNDSIFSLLVLCSLPGSREQSRDLITTCRQIVHLDPTIQPSNQQDQHPIIYKLFHPCKQIFKNQSDNYLQLESSPRLSHQTNQHPIIYKPYHPIKQIFTKQSDNKLKVDSSPRTYQPVSNHLQSDTIQLSNYSKTNLIATCRHVDSFPEPNHETNQHPIIYQPIYHPIVQLFKNQSTITTII